MFLATGLAAWLATGLAGCSSTLDVRSLATERADVAAFELAGRDLAALRREASLLCPQGGEILRQSAREQRLEVMEGRLDQWVQLSSSWITPPERKAQLVVLCQAVPEWHLLASAAAGQALAAVSTAATASAPARAPGASVAPGAPRLPLVSGLPRVPSVPGVPSVPSMPIAPGVPIGPLSVEW
ncbi:MAG: hypothetical protein H7242_08450 [Microbacteriaceae bacterium]|nr:hypothetical protein [Burkholderiaceae bacterium]